MGYGDVQSEDELYDFDTDTDPPNWQQLVSRELLLGLKPYEIKRQEVINGEFKCFLVAVLLGAQEPIRFLKLMISTFITLTA